MLEKAVDELESTSRATKLKDECRTRWVERIDAYATFLDLLTPLHATLQAMVHPTSHSNLGVDWSWDGETITRANGFLFQLQSSSFLVSLHLLVQVFQVLKELMVKLQSVAIDVVQAYSMVESVVTVLKDMRRESESEFTSNSLRQLHCVRSSMVMTSNSQGLVLLVDRHIVTTHHHQVRRPTIESLSMMSSSHM